MYYSDCIFTDVMSALRNLQLRLRKIEQEKQQAELHLNSLSRDGFSGRDVVNNASAGDSINASGFSQLCVYCIRVNPVLQ